MFDMKYMNLIVEGCFSQENCSLKILQFGTMCGIYYVHLEHSKAGQNNSIFYLC